MVITVTECQTEQMRKDAYHVRFTVFVEEQQVPEEEEIDDLEEEAVHFTAYDEKTPVGAGRLRLIDKKGKAERMCVLPSYRKKGVGRQLMEWLEQRAKDEGAEKIVLNAQVQAKPFYQSINYEVTSGQFLDAGIPHVTMEKQL
ncbi:GNAT family N-acetyltransferase [Salsuginibacillus kocurii]|uniref:GNAT family N-acetyltransferase n=1 Tax=Salsuginibacillus kocurii TaxID=427078 RepID=UPI003B8459F9